jgi:AAA domain-containing protein
VVVELIFVGSFLSPVTKAKRRSDGCTVSANNKSDDPLIWVLEPMVTDGLMPAPEWFIEDMFPENCLGALYGQPGAFKTWTAVAEAMCLGTGLPFCGKRVQRCNVLYIAADDPMRPQQRAQAWVKYYDPVLKAQGIDPFANVLILKKPINLYKDDLRTAVENIQRQGFKPDVIFYDTFFHSTVGADLQKPEVVLPIVDRLRALGKELGARGSKVIHHTPKEGDKLFGSQTLLASIDLSWLLEEKKGSPNTATLTCKRMRGARNFDPIELTFQSIELRMAPNRWGNEWIEQLVLASDVKPAPKAKTKEDEDLEDMEMLLECFLGNKATFTAWLEQMWKYFKVKEDDKDKKGWSKRSFARRLDILKEKGRVTGGGNQGDFYSVVNTEEAERARRGEIQPESTKTGARETGASQAVTGPNSRGLAPVAPVLGPGKQCQTGATTPDGTASRSDCKNDNTTQSPSDDELIKAGIGEATKKRTY